MVYRKWLERSPRSAMKILWVSPSFLHPTDRGGQIRTLGTLKELHKRHEIDFVALNPPSNSEGPERSCEYSTRHVAIPHSAPSRKSLSILPQLVRSILSSVPLAVSRYASPALKQKVRDLAETAGYDVIVCDFLASVPNVASMAHSILFQHNVETTIWQRHAQASGSSVRKIFFAAQARKMKAFEKSSCRQAKFVIAVSALDAQRMKQMFTIDHVKSVPTGVDLEYFCPPQVSTGNAEVVSRANADTISRDSDIVFCGSMDWLPNVDAMEHFLLEILPLIRAQRPGTTVTVAGRSPDARVLKAANGLAGVKVTGDVPDMRPYLWGARISVVPIRIGGGTRLKIYEAMAAGLPIVSSTVGAEGLSYTDGQDIVIRDSPADFASECVRLLDDPSARQSLARNALRLVKEKFSWAVVTQDFEAILEANRLPRST